MFHRLMTVFVLDIGTAHVQCEYKAANPPTACACSSCCDIHDVTVMSFISYSGSPARVRPVRTAYCTPVAA